jgi:hypothetical protein
MGGVVFRIDFRIIVAAAGAQRSERKGSLV